MKTKSTATIAVITLLPLVGFAQPQPNPPAPPAPPLPGMPGGPPPDRHSEKKVPTTYLGVETSEVPNVVSEQLGLAKGFGLVVDYVVPDGPAAAAGVQQNDIVKMLNDQILTDPEQLSKLIRSFSDGTNVTLTVLRKGQEQKIPVKLARKDMPQRAEFGRGRHRGNSDFHFDMGDFGMNGLQEQMRDMKEQIGEQQREMIRDTVVKAREEAARAREQAMHVRDEALRSAGRIHVTKGDADGGVKTTNIDIGKAQIVFSDDKGELRLEKIDGKKVLTAKNPQGLLLFSGPVETKEDLDKVPVEVRQRYENLEQKELPDALSSGGQEEENDAGDVEEENDDDMGTTTQQVSLPVISRQFLRL
jgi:serine protease Do